MYNRWGDQNIGYKTDTFKKRQRKSQAKIIKKTSELERKENERRGFKKRIHPYVEMKCSKAKQVLDQSSFIGSDGQLYSIKDSCKEMLDCSDTESYDGVKSKLDKLIKELEVIKIAEEVLKEPRLTIMELDGKVKYDSFKNTRDSSGNIISTDNTFDKYKNGEIGENHNSRKSVMEAHLNDDEDGMEVKRSNTTGNLQAYVSQMLNDQNNIPKGVARLSINDTEPQLSVNLIVSSGSENTVGAIYKAEPTVLNVRETPVFKYKWWRLSVDGLSKIEVGTNSDSYTIVADDVGLTVEVVVSYNIEGGFQSASKKTGVISE